MGMLGGLQALGRTPHTLYGAAGRFTRALSHRISAISKWVRYCQQSFALAVSALLVIDGQLTAGAMIAANVLQQASAGCWSTRCGPLSNGGWRKSRKQQNVMCKHQKPRAY